MAFEQEAARERMSFEQSIAVHQQDQADRNSEREMGRKDKETDAKLSKNRPGGKLDE
jgi:hypothetical protein